MIENKTLSDRGFKGGKFVDGYGQECSIQESSRVMIEGETEGWYIWLGPDNPKIMKDLRTGPGTEVVLDDTHSIFSRMHLSQRQVKEMIPHLQFFVGSGYLPTLEELTAFNTHMEPMQSHIDQFFNEVNT